MSVFFECGFAPSICIYRLLIWKKKTRHCNTNWISVTKPQYGLLKYKKQENSSKNKSVLLEAAWCQPLTPYTNTLSRNPTHDGVDESLARDNQKQTKWRILGEKLRKYKPHVGGWVTKRNASGKAIINAIISFLYSYTGWKEITVVWAFTWGRFSKIIPIISHENYWVPEAVDFTML